jgi:hypothetical protein
LEPNITSVLNIDLQLLAEGDGPALVILETEWEAEGRSTQPEKLIRVLKKTIDCCKSRGIVYPRIFLRRKGELTRREFKPSTGFSDRPLRLAAPTHSKIPEEWIRAETEKFNARITRKV